jgi:hypothetical protein
MLFTIVVILVVNGGDGGSVLFFTIASFVIYMQCSNTHHPYAIFTQLFSSYFHYRHKYSRYYIILSQPLTKQIFFILSSCVTVIIILSLITTI